MGRSGQSKNGLPKVLTWCTQQRGLCFFVPADSVAHFPIDFTKWKFCLPPPLQELLCEAAVSAFIKLV